MQKIIVSKAVLLSVAIFNSSTQAQEQATPQQKVASEQTTQQVEVKSKNVEELARTDTAAKTVVNNEALIKFGDSNIIDALKRTPGVMVTNGKLHLSGMGTGYTQILIDGEPPRGVSIEDIPMSSIDRVEIYRGGNAQFSAQAMAGTINIILKKVPQTAQEQIKLGHTQAYKPSNTLEFFKSDKPSKKLSYSISINARQNFIATFVGGKRKSETKIADQQNDLIQYYTNASERNNQDQIFSINPRVQYETSGGMKLTFTSPINYNKNNGISQEKYQFLFGDTLSSASLRTNSDNSSFGISPNIKSLISLSDQAKLDINFGVNFSSANGESHVRSKDVSNQENINRDSQTDSKRYGFNHTGKLTIPSNETHDIVTGWTYSSSQSSSDRQELITNFMPSTSNFDVQNTKAQIDKYAVYGQDEWKFNKQSSAYFGLRWEGMSIKSEGTTQEKLKHQSSVWSPVLQTLWQLNSDNQDRLRAGISRSYQAPFDFFLISPKFMSLNNSAQNPNFIGNPALRPELAWNLDLAYEHNGKDEWNYNIRAKIQKIDGVFSEKIYFSNNAWWRQMFNLNRATSQSLELDTQFPLKRFIKDAPQIDISLAYSRHWSEIKGLPKPFNRVAPYTYQFSLNLDYRAKDWPLNTGLNLRMQDSLWQQTSLSEKSFFESPSNIDVYALWKFNKKTQVRFAIDNLMKSNDKNSMNVRTFEQISVYQSNYGQALRRLKLNFEHKF
jgi:outer membrane receptor protein involved in Fe transport